MPAPAVVFYISGHGFGHASREVEVINALGTARPDLTIVLRTDVSPALLRRTLQTDVTLLEGACDTGVIQRDSVTHDDEATMRKAIAFHHTFDTRRGQELARLTSYDVRAIVGDIPPLAFDVASKLGVPSLAIANFTWDWIYEWYPESLREAPDLLGGIRRSYRRASHALELPLSGGFEVFSRVSPLPFIARQSKRTRRQTRQFLKLDYERPVALLSFGGYGLPQLDMARLDCLKGWTVLMTDRITAPGGTSTEQIRFLPEESFGADLRYEDLVAASDVVITKPGYGIVSECVAHHTAMLYTSRGHFREYDTMVRQMPALLRCRFISQADLFAGRWAHALDGLMAQPPGSSQVATDGASRAAEIIQAEVDTCSAPGSKSSGD